MGKFLSGCLIAVAVIVVGGGAFGYFYFIKPAGQFVSDMAAFAEEYEALNGRIEQRDDFQPPATASSGRVSSSASWRRTGTCARGCRRASRRWKPSTPSSRPRWKTTSGR